jgi:RsiW-degrading membrane proteinase PrsW (M82 family)
MEPGTFWTAFVWAVVPALILLGAIWWVDRYEKEPLRLIGIALLFGAVLAPVIAYAIEKGLDISTSFTAQTIVPETQLGVGLPLVEEIIRGAAVLVVFLLVRFEIDDLLDGIVYGGIVGVGFGAAANFVSIWSTPSLGGDNTPSLYSSMITGLNHVFYGAVIGLALAAVRKGNLQMLGGAAVVGIAAAFLFHVLHDYLPWWASSSGGTVESNFGTRLLTQIPNYLGVFVLGLIALWTIGREKVIIAQELREEVKNGVVTPDDFANVTNSFRRTQTLWMALLNRGEWVWRLRRKLYGLEAELAFRKYHRREETSAQSRAFQSEESYREQIRETRKELAEVDPSAARSRRTAEPPGPSSRFVAGVGGLTVFALVVVAGILVWLLALRPDEQPTRPTRPLSSNLSAAPASLFGIPNGFQGSALARLATSRLAAPTAAQATLQVLACTVKGNKCARVFRSGSVIPKASPRVAFIAVFQGLGVGSTLDMLFVNLATRQFAAKPVRFKLSASKGIAPAFFKGPLPKIDLGVALAYNGTLIKKIWAFRLA